VAVAQVTAAGTPAESGALPELGRLDPPHIANRVEAAVDRNDLADGVVDARGDVQRVARRELRVVGVEAHCASDRLAIDRDELAEQI
jgi:hypothetical protein